MALRRNLDGRMPIIGLNMDQTFQVPSSKFQAPVLISELGTWKFAPARFTIRPMNLVSAFHSSVQKHSGKIVLYWGDREFSYAELWNQSVLVSQELRRKFQVKPGNHIGLWLKNCPEFVPMLFGILHAGAVAVPINNFLKPDEVSYILRDSGIDVLITDEELGAQFPALVAARPALRLLKIESLPWREAKDNQAVQGGLPEIPETALAILIYTSGTTGRPKARCFPMATCSTTSKAAISCSRPLRKTA
jgi:acyl-CoA synthetase (AMP-forming)/AMP-acid ligase II